MHYALRWGRGLAIGLLLGAIWYWLFFDLRTPVWLEASLSSSVDDVDAKYIAARAFTFLFLFFAFAFTLTGIDRMDSSKSSNSTVLTAFAISMWVAGITNFLFLVHLNESQSISVAPRYISHVLFESLMPTVLVLGLPAFAYFREKLTEHPEYRRWFAFGKGSSGRWAGPATFEDRDVRDAIGRELPVLKEDDSGRTLKSIYLGKTWVQDDVRPRHVGIADDAHLMTIAGTGAGKSTTAIWPNLCLYEGAAIVLDPKGEHARRTIGRRQGLRPRDYVGYFAGVDTEGVTRTTRRLTRTRCFLLDPFKQVPEYEGHAYNLLADVNIAADDVRGLLSAISDGCIVPEGAQNAHFVESAKIVIEGLMAHVLSRHPEEHQNLPYIADLVQGLDPEIGLADPGKLDELLLEMRSNDAAGGLPMMAANVLDSAGDRERGSILTTCFRSLKWATDPAMRKTLSRSDFRFSDVVSRDGNTLYIVLPTQFMKESEQIRWMRCLVNLMIAQLERRKANELKLPLLFVLDEFPQLGTLKPIEQGIVLLRSQGVKLWPILQDIGQLKSLYKENWETFVGASTIQLFGIADMQTAEWASDRLGQGFRTTTEKNGKSSTKRAERCSLLEPDEVINLLGKDEPTQIVIPRNGYPMRLTRMSFRPYGRFKGLPLDGHYDTFGL